MEFTERQELGTLLRFLDCGEGPEAWHYHHDSKNDIQQDVLPLHIEDASVEEMMRGSPIPARVSVLDRSVNFSEPAAPFTMAPVPKQRATKAAGAATADAVAPSRAAIPSSDSVRSKAGGSVADGVGSAATASGAASASSGASARKSEPFAGFNSKGKVVFSKAPVVQDAFARAEILPVSTGGDAQDMGLIAAAMRRSRGGVGSVSLKLEVYLPNRTPMAVEVRASASVHDVIVAVLKQHRAERRRPALRDGSNCYELRLHEEDGYPDEDFPALDRARQISNFAQGGAHEYCLCEIPGMKPTVTTSTRNLQRMQSLAAFKCIKIIMPDSSLVPYTVMKVTPTLRVADVIRSLARNRKYRLSIYHDEYVLKLGKDDQARLRRSAPELSPRDIIEALEVEEVQLCKRSYADTPPEPEVKKRTEKDGDDEFKQENTGATQFGHNLLSAAAYKEWTVVKVNKRGRRQTRIMGIDLTKICNKKVNKKRLLAAETVQRPERVISDILQLRIPDHNGTVFFITFRESAYEDITIEYEAASPADRAAIVAKLDYILNLNHAGDRVVRPEPKRAVGSADST